MKKRQREKILKRAGIKLYKGFPVAGLSALELQVCTRKSESNTASALFNFAKDLTVKNEPSGIDHLNQFMKVVREAGSIESVTGVKRSDLNARV